MTHEIEKNNCHFFLIRGDPIQAPSWSGTCQSSLLTRDSYIHQQLLSSWVLQFLDQLLSLMSWNLVELLPCRATTIDHFPSYSVMSFLSSWKVVFLVHIWNLIHMATSFPSMLLLGVSIHRMNVGFTCTYKSCSSSPTLSRYYSRNQNIILHQIIPYEIALHHDIFM